MRRHGGGGSWHDSGQAFDISGGAMDDHDNRVKALEIGKKYGLVGQDEYEHPASTTTGPNVHFSDHGDAIPEGAGGGVTTRTVHRKKHTAQDVDDVIQRWKVAANDYNNGIKEQKQQRLDQIKNEVAQLSGQQLMDRLESLRSSGDVDGYSVAKNVAQTMHPELFRTSSRTDSRNNGRSYNSQWNTIGKFGYNLRAGSKITPEELYNAKIAGLALEDNGQLNADDAADVSKYESDQQFMSNLTDDIEENGLTGATQNLMQNGMSATAAAILISKADPSYADAK